MFVRRVKGHISIKPWASQVHRRDEKEEYLCFFFQAHFPQCVPSDSLRPKKKYTNSYAKTLEIYIYTYSIPIGRSQRGHANPPHAGKKTSL